MRRGRVELGGVGAVEPGEVARGLDDHALQAQAQPQRRDAPGAGVPDRADLALDAAHAEPARDQHAVHPVEGRRRAGRGLALVGLDPADLDLGPVREPARAQRLGDRQVGVGQVDVLADQRDRHGLVGVVDAVEQVAPDRPVDVAEREPEPAHDVGVEPFAVQDTRDVVDRRRVGRGGDPVEVDVAHQRDLALEPVRDLPVRAQHQRVGLDADVAQSRDGVLGRLGLELTGGREERHERDVQEEAVVAAHVVADLPRGLQERQRLDVADRPAHLRDHDVRRGAVVVGGRHREDAVLDLVGDVRDDLHGVAQVLAAALLGDHRRVDLPGGDVRPAVQVPVEEPLVVADVEVGLGPVLGDEHLAVLERVHRPGVHVEVRVELLHRDPQPAGGEELAEAGRRQTLAEGGGDSSGDEQMTRGALLHGFSAYRRPTGNARAVPPLVPGSGRIRASAGALSP